MKPGRYRNGVGDVSKGRHAAETASDETPALGALRTGEEAQAKRARGRRAPRNIKGLEIPSAAKR
jgi:hypothetical protein